MSLKLRLFSLSLFVATATISVGALSAQEIEPVPLLAAGNQALTGLSIVYDPASGGVLATAPVSTDLTALQLLSQGGLFTGQCQSVEGVFDICDPDEVFKLVIDGFSTVDFGPILQANLDGETLLKDLRVNGASVGGGFEVGDGPFLVHPDFLVPEPAAGFICGCGLLGLIVSLRGQAHG